MNKYSVFFGGVAELLLPPSKRQQKRLALLRSVLEPLQALRDVIFNTYRLDIIRRTRYSAQVIVFERILNDFFNITSSPKIYISNTSAAGQPLYFYRSDEGYEPVYFDNVQYFISSEEYNPTTDFTVNVPVFLQGQEQIIRSVVNRYKLAGTRYQISFY
jgi:hypothetical protein